METNPYAPPKAAVLELPTIPGLKRRRVITMIVFTILTIGLYYVLWFFRRRGALNRLNSSRKLQLWPLLVLVAYFAMAVVIGIATGEEPIETVLGPGVAKLLNLVDLLIGILMVWQCFIIKDILEDHLAPENDGSRVMFTEGVKLSGFMTFIFGMFYLQHIINTHIAGPQVS
jgi:hypothetical protein